MAEQLAFDSGEEAGAISVQAPMRGLTLWRPWSDAIVNGPKRVENRPWAPAEKMLGKLIAIHAGQKYDPGAWGLPDGYAARGDAACPKGIVGVARILGWLDLRPPKEPDGELRRTRLAIIGCARQLRAQLRTLDQDAWWAGPVGWLLGDVEALPEPIPHPGSLGLWRVPPEKVARILEMLGG